MKKAALFLFAALFCVVFFSACGAKEHAPAILVVSFGTSENDNRDLSIGGVEAAIAAAYPSYDVRRAFTSQIVIDKLKKRDGIDIDNVKQALDKLVKEKAQTVVIQPTHVMGGLEYDSVVEDAAPYTGKFARLVIGSPLLTSAADFDALADIIISERADDADTAVVYMGHGTEHAANAVYTKLQRTLDGKGQTRRFVGTVEAEPTLEDTLVSVQGSGAKRVVLLPLMIVAGVHAREDMADLNDPGSWASVFTANGFEVECVMKGLGQYPAVQDMFVAHVKEALNE